MVSVDLLIRVLLVLAGPQMSFSNDGIWTPSHQRLVQGQTILRVSDLKEISAGKSKAAFLPWVAAIATLRPWGSETRSLPIVTSEG